MFLSLIMAVLIYVHVFFLVAVLRKNFAVMDIAWGLGFILISLMTYMHHPLSLRNALVLMVVTFWGLRLALHIYHRNKGQSEDPRYAKLRAEWGRHAHLQAYLKIFLFQGLLMLVISLPISVGMTQEVKEFSFLNALGFIVWLFGFCFESWSDLYLSRFKTMPENKGKICTTGPWRFCRFPNYFGEVTLWYGIYLLSFDFQTSWTIIGPLTLNFLILKVTGVPLLEEKYMKRPEYQEYAKRVPKLVPRRLKPAFPPEIPNDK